MSSKFAERHKLIFLSFCGFAILYAMRVNLSVAIVAMIKTKEPSINPYGNIQNKTRIEYDVCPIPAGQLTVDIKDEDYKYRIFNWDEATQGAVLGSFFYGYTFTNIIGGRLAEKYGGGRIFGFGVIFTAILTVISPLVANISTDAFMLIRVLEGMTEGVTFPAMNVLMSNWIPPGERSRSIAQIMGGCQFGTVVTLATSGWLCQSSWGWPSVFYLFGSLGVVWGIFWFNIIYDSPECNPNILSKERMYINQSLGGGGKKCSNVRVVPWSCIFTNVPFIAVVVAQVCANWGFYNLLTELPTYLSNVQHFVLKENGIISAIPYLIMWIFGLSYSVMMDRILKKEFLTLCQVRKISTSLALFGPMILLALVSKAGCNTRLAVTLICLAVGVSSAGYSGFMCAFQELAPNYAGTLTGLSNTLATVPGFLAPKVTGIIINQQQTLSRWTEVFHLTSIIYLFGGVFYLCFMSIEVQPWNTFVYNDREKLINNQETHERKR